jgi:alpha-ribazole phosphatase
MKTLYLIRHTTPRIAPGTCYGQLDIGVADHFDEEANDILCWLPPVELIVTSPLQRTRRLAEHLAQSQHCELHSDARLIEKHFGAWEGRAWDDIARSEIDAWAANVSGYAPPDGESAQQLMQRVRAFMRDLAQLPQQNIALVAQIGGLPLTNTLNWEIEYGAVIGVRVCRN